MGFLLGARLGPKNCLMSCIMCLLPTTQPTQPTKDQLSTNALKLRGSEAKKAILVQCFNVFVLSKTQRKQGQLSTKALQL